MSSSKQLGRIVDGLSLVAREIVKRSKLVESTRNGDLETVIASSLKRALVSATDISGLTSGKVRDFSKPRSKEESSVVFFDNEGDNINKVSSAVAESGASREESNSFDVSTSSNTVQDIVEGTSVEVQVLSDDRIVKDDRLERECEVKNVVNQGTNVEGGAGFKEAAAAPEPVVASEPVVLVKRRTPRERRVPSTPFTRALGFAGLGASLAWGTVQESAKRIVYGTPNVPNQQNALSPFLSEKNAERLALALCRMRGAALKIGQMLSIQDETLVPAPILAALDIVRQGADVMPRSQLNQVLDAELGVGWSAKLTSFDYEPLASASIGQVHRAVTKDNINVAMKIQYPGVADSIESDIENVKLLLDYTNLIPEGLYLESAMKVAKEELSRECDYKVEAANQKRFRHLLSDVEGFYVPSVVDELCSQRVLTTELVSGMAIDKVALLDQETRNNVGCKLLELTLMELFVYRFMQTDPNWGNFLYDDQTKTINLIDFGAARDFPKKFVDDYLGMVLACSNNDREAIIEMSTRLGFLTGAESDIMLDAHVQAGVIVGLPFAKAGGYDFRSSNITQSITNLGTTMLKHRKSPPPDEAYSLHRKLAGAFLACIKIGAVVPCRELLLQVSKRNHENDRILSGGLVS